MQYFGAILTLLLVLACNNIDKYIKIYKYHFVNNGC